MDVGKGFVLTFQKTFTDYPDLRYDIENGITLCDVCHKGFHKKHGYGRNTKEQFREYLCSVQTSDLRSTTPFDSSI